MAASIDSAEAGIHRLPNEVLCHIFWFIDTKDVLTTLSGVCRRWRDAVPKAPISFNMRDILSMRQGKGKSKVLKILEKIIGKPSGQPFFADLLRRFRVEEISLHGPHFEICTAATIAANCPHLVAFSFGGKVDDDHIIQLAKSCPKLKYVDISCPKVNDASVVALAQNCPGLRELRVTYNYLTDVSMKALGDHSPDMTHIEIHGGRIKDPGVIYFAERCTKLVSVRFPECDDLTTAARTALEKHCPNLYHQNWLNCYMVDGYEDYS